MVLFMLLIAHFIKLTLIKAGQCLLHLPLGSYLNHFNILKPNQDEPETQTQNFEPTIKVWGLNLTLLDNAFHVVHATVPFEST